MLCPISWLGDCEGAKGKPGQYLRGQLAGLVLMTNTTDSNDAIDCLNRCQEKLELSGMDFMDNGMVSEPPSDTHERLAENADVQLQKHVNILN